MRKAYEASGVNVEAGYEAVERIKSHAARTKVPGVLGGLGGFGGLFEPNLSGIKEPVFVSGTDGVGTKLKLAFLLDKHDTVGIDCVAMCVNDVVCGGAKPLFFLDYIAVGKNSPAQVEEIVKGIADGCVEAGCALVGGETAEMPGFYPVGEYDVAGFCVGVVDKSKILTPERMREGDAVLALASSGVHSNGFSLVRRVFGLDGEEAKANLSERFSELGGERLGDVLLTPTRIYVREVLRLFEAGVLNGAAHITGGGFFENVPRCLGDGFGVEVEREKVRVLPIFELLTKRAGLCDVEAFSTFNMGVGMVFVVPRERVSEAFALVPELYEIGRVVKGSGVNLKGAR